MAQFKTVYFEHNQNYTFFLDNMYSSMIQQYTALIHVIAKCKGAEILI